MIPIKVLQKQIEYKGCPIILRQIGSDTFEYITTIRGEIYSSRIIAKKSILRRLTFRDYSLKEINGVTQYIIAMAQTTIETVLDPLNKTGDNSPKGAQIGGSAKQEKGAVLSPLQMT